MTEIICLKEFVPYLEKIGCKVVHGECGETRVFTDDTLKAQHEADRLCKGYKLLFADNYTK